MPEDNTRISTTSPNTKLLWAGRVDAGFTYSCGPNIGYSRCKNVVIYIKVVTAHGTPPTVAFTLFQGPDASTLVSYKAVITAASATANTVLAGSTDANSDGQFGDLMEGRVACAGSNWASIEIYEVRKPF